MATELSNYDNDYRERYRGPNNPSVIGVETAAAANASIPMPNEATYGMYADGSGTAADPFNVETFDLPAASTDIALLPGVTNVTGEIQGRYSLNFAITEAGDVGEPRSVNDFNIASGANPPASPSVGTLWYDTTNLALMVYINDGNSLQWVQAN